MAARGVRIAISVAAVLLLLLAVILATAAVCTPEWQWAYLEQVDQLHYLGLWQKCVYGSRQGPTGPRQWQCTFIPFEPYRFRNQMFSALGGTVHQFDISSNTNRVDYTAFGGESWRLATLVLLIIGALVGFLSLVFEIIEICLDATRTLKCLKAMSGLSLAMLAFATLCTCIGVIVFARNSQESHNLYVLELTAFSIQQLGTSFYLGVGAAAAFFIALIIDVCSTAVICATARPDRREYRKRLYFTAESEKAPPVKVYSPPPTYQSPPGKIVTEQQNNPITDIQTLLENYGSPPTRKIPINEKLNINIPTLQYHSPKDDKFYLNNLKPLNSKQTVSSVSSTVDMEDIVWKYPKMSRV